jgi:hypothetical protein
MRNTERPAGSVLTASPSLTFTGTRRTNVCPDFGLVWDVHDGHKHATLNRPNRQVTNAGQTGVRHMTYGQVYNEGVYGGGTEIVIRLDNGSKRELRLVMQNVMAMWEKLLVDMGL